MKWFLLFVVALGVALATANSDSSYSYYRLPTALRPQKYHLRILTNLENPEDLKFAGTVKIIIEALENSNNITLHSKNLTIDESQITLREINGDKKDNCVSSTAVNPSHDFYILKTCQELVAGSIYELSLPFAADLNRQLEGYYRSSYKDPVANATRWDKNPLICEVYNSINCILDGSLSPNSNQHRRAWLFPASMSRISRHLSLSRSVITKSTLASVICQ